MQMLQYFTTDNDIIFLIAGYPSLGTNTLKIYIGIGIQCLGRFNGFITYVYTQHLYPRLPRYLLMTPLPHPTSSTTLS